MAATKAKREWPADRVQRWRVDKLVPYARNARTHSAEQVDQIAASIQQWGWTMPVLIDETGMLIAGHGRVMAAEKIGLVDVPAMVARGWTEEQKAAYVLADNKLALNAGWDEELLLAELGDLEDAGFDLGLMGFSDAEMAKLVASMEEEAAGVEDHWTGMPEFEHEDKTAFRTIPVHFKDQAAVDAFAELIGQKITEKTRFVWFPEVEIERYADKRYERGDGAAVSDLHSDEGSPRIHGDQQGSH